MNFYDLLLLISAVLGLTYYFVRQRYSYWERLNIPYVQPTFPFGNLKELSELKSYEKYYNQLKGSSQFSGLYSFIKPLVLATNLDFVKNVLIKDFDHFNSRGLFYNEIDDPLSVQLLSVDGEKWRRLRMKLTAPFGSAKMKSMFPIILNVADELKNTINAGINGTNADFEMKDILARFTTDIIVSCAFGIECNSLRNENNEFRKYGRSLVETPRNTFLKLLFLTSFRDLARKLRMKLISDDISKFFIGSLKETIKYREENNVKRNDFLNILMQLMRHGKMDEDDDDSENHDKLSFNEVAAQSFLFFLAGFETSSSTSMFCLFELSVNPEIQSKARQEVIDVLKKHNGEFTYDAMVEMHYVERCIQETMRKYPPAPSLARQCSKDYLVTSTNITLQKGTTVVIPVYGIHHDPDIYPNPSIYDPDRFLPDEVQKRHPLSWIPFGDGPRKCLGIRFGLMQTTAAIATILKHFEISLSSKSSNPLVLSLKTLLLVPEGGVWLNMKSIKV